ncbi:TlpA disulfide reductase family protein [Rhizosphaericola mali]|uniref:Redoxin domain-containing protein n=1 Tax=Rhizosphaericola mali TaxID=2545455 RepID=A0A5P2G474_9BACT|nr:TlpA disulfide reductase family protein [Rhizosphaericola mali]QES90624.1 redoxin domain-containing protein [Rhizosphaericola mali]
MLQTKLTKMAFLTFGMFSIGFANAQEKTSSELYKQFEDSLHAKVPETSLLKLKMNYLQLNQRRSANDSIDKEIISIYPKGQVASMVQIIQDFKKIQAEQYTLQDFNKLKTEFPDVNFDDENSAAGSYYTALKSSAYPIFLIKDTTKVQEYSKELSAEVLNSISWKWAESGQHLSIAEILSKKSLEKTKAAIEKLPTSDSSETSKDLKQSYSMYEDTYAVILSKEGKKAEALKYEEDAYTYLKGAESDINGTYITLLNENKQWNKALEIGSKVYKVGKGNDIVKAQLEAAYKKVYPERDVTPFIEELDKQKEQAEKATLLASMINKPSHDFTLKNLQGKKVSLSSLKGKVVIIDFWATWCGPCKMSFPGMQLAVNKYKDNKDVVFLFVDTWERSTPEQRFKEVSSFIQEKKYTFQVLLDEPSKTNGKEFDVIKSYGVTGIPTKFIIGRDGNIKFEMVGFSGSDQGVLTEVSNAVNLLLKS